MERNVQQSCEGCPEAPGQGWGEEKHLSALTSGKKHKCSCITFVRARSGHLRRQQDLGMAQHREVGGSQPGPVLHQPPWGCSSEKAELGGLPGSTSRSYLGQVLLRRDE